MKVFKNPEIKQWAHCKTQNIEGVNALKWKRCPKDIYVDLTVLNIGTASSVSKFNAAMVRVLRVFVNSFMTEAVII